MGRPRATAALNSGSNVSISTGAPGSAGGQSGNIDVESDIIKTSGAVATLTLTAAYGIKKALVRLAQALPVGAQVVATIHDEIVVECEEAQAPDVLAMTKTTMIEGMAEIAKDCQVEVEGGIGKTWGSAK